MHGPDFDDEDFIKIVMGMGDMKDEDPEERMHDKMKMKKKMMMKEEEGDEPKSAEHLLKKIAHTIKEYCGDECDGMEKKDHDDDDDDDKEGEGDDWKQLAAQLMQAISLIDTHTDGVNEGTEKPEGALEAIDNETSRLLWGKQDEDNPLSSYQNANYGKKTANGFMMENEADLDNEEAYAPKDKPGKEEKPEKPKKKGKPVFVDDDMDDDDEKDFFSKKARM